MFVQVIRGRTSDPAGMRALGERWRQEVGPGAEGFLGVTAGATADGEAVTIARFVDEASARRNSERAEQASWWEAMSGLYVAEPSFAESGDVDQLLNGDPNEAGFVQVMEGTCADLAAARDFERRSEPILKEMRPDLLGLFRVNHPDGRFTQAAYFRSEAEARRGEAAEADEMPAEVAEGMRSYAENLKTERWLDLADPQLF